MLVSDGANNFKLNTNKYDRVIKELLRYDISVYGVGVGASYFNRKFEHLAKYTKDSGTSRKRPEGITRAFRGLKL